MNLRLKERRESLGLTQQELAKKVGKSFRTIQSWERGESYPNAEFVVVLCRIFDIDPNELLGWYIDHPEDRPAPPGDPGAAELVGCYRSCTPERQDALFNLARDSALLSGPAAERGAVSEAV